MITQHTEYVTTITGQKYHIYSRHSASTLCRKEYFGRDSYALKPAPFYFTPLRADTCKLCQKVHDKQHTSI